MHDGIGLSFIVLFILMFFAGYLAGWAGKKGEKEKKRAKARLKRQEGKTNNAIENIARNKTDEIISDLEAAKGKDSYELDFVRNRAKDLNDKKLLFDYCNEKGRSFLASKEYDKALFYFNFASSLGDAGAIYNLGVCYFNGLGVEKDENEGVDLFFIASEKEYRLAVDMLMSTRKTEDVKNALCAHENAFEKENDEVKSNLIRCAKNIGDKFFWCKAAIIYDKGAGAGDEYCRERAIECAVKSGDLYYSSYKKYKQKEDINAAIFYYNIVAKYDKFKSQVDLGICCLFGGKCDLALKLIKPAAERGDGRAQYYLAGCYYYGVGEKNYFLAHEWYKKAAQNGIEDAQTMCSRLEKDIDYCEQFDVNRYKNRLNPKLYQYFWNRFSHESKGSKFDPYLVLGVDKNAPFEEIKNEFLNRVIGRCCILEDDPEFSDNSREFQENEVRYIASMAVLKKAWNMIKKERGL